MVTTDVSIPMPCTEKPHEDGEASIRSSSVKSSQLSSTATASIHDEKSETTAEDVPPPYSIFSKPQKTVIVGLAAISSFISPFSANIYFPVLNVLQEDMHTTASLISLTVTVYMIFQGISPSFWGGLADHWGRRPVYIMTILIYVLACIGLALATDYTTLIALRMLQAFGSSSVIAIGAGTIGDIATPAERGGYMGVYSLGTMLGPILGPVLGGILSQQYGWRSIFWLLAIFGSCLWCVVTFFLPETLRKLVGDGSGYANPTPTQFIRRRLANFREKRSWDRNNSIDSGTGTFAVTESKEEATVCHEEHAEVGLKRFLKFPNPFQSVVYLREKDIAVVLLYNSLQYAGFYCVLTSNTEIFTDIYNLNVMQVGLCYLANGFGSGLGSFTSGRILNWKFRRVAAQLGMEASQIKRGDMDPNFPIESARMSITWIWGLAFNVALILYGWLLHIKVHIGVTLFLHVILGYCSASTFNATNTLLVDLFPKNSAAIVASNNLTRCLLGAVAVYAVSPGIAALGVGWLFTVVSLILFVSRILMVIELRLGPKWRKERCERNAQKQLVH